MLHHSSFFILHSSFFILQKCVKREGKFFLAADGGVRQRVAAQVVGWI